MAKREKNHTRTGKLLSFLPIQPRPSPPKIQQRSGGRKTTAVNHTSASLVVEEQPH